MGTRAGATQAVVASLLFVASVGLLVAAPAGGPDAGVADFGESSPRTGAEFVARLEEPRVDREVGVVAQLEPDASVPAVVRSRSDVRLTVQESGEGRRLTGRVPLSEVQTLSDALGTEGVRIDTSGIDGRDDTTVPGVTAVGAAALHERGVTGENVTVGVIDEGFRLSHPAVADQVGAYNAFGESGSPAHGTAVADVVTDTAPGATLHLAAVGPTTTPGEYRAAVRWLQASGADVIVDSGSYLGTTGSEGIAAVAANASEEVVFVTSAGNAATRHWSGLHRPGHGSASTDDALGSGLPGTIPREVAGLVGGTTTSTSVQEWVTFEGDRRNRLGAGPVSGRVTVALEWEGAADYDLYLVRLTGAGEVVWDSSTTATPGRERLSVVVPRGRYAVAVGYDGGTAPETRLRLLASHRLETTTTAGSLAAPATAEGVLTVGALDDDGDGVAAYSSRGPTPDGRLGVDVLAPATGPVGEGTSFAAPYVAGTAAILLSEYPTVGENHVQRIVVESATDLGSTGPDPATGHGRLAAVAAHRTVGTLVTVARPVDPLRRPSGVDGT